jgi:hypothetical protein
VSKRDIVSAAQKHAKAGITITVENVDDASACELIDYNRVGALVMATVDLRNVAKAAPEPEPVEVEVDMAAVRERFEAEIKAGKREAVIAREIGIGQNTAKRIRNGASPYGKTLEHLAAWMAGAQG